MPIDLIQFFAELITSIFKHGLSLTTLAVAVTALLRVQGIRKVLTKRLPKRFRQEDRLERLESKIDALMSAQEVAWDVDWKIGKNAQHVINGQQTKLSSQPAAYAPATLARYFTRLKETYPSQQRRMNMKSKLLSRKFLMAVISAALVIANDGLSLGLDQNTIIAFGTIVVGWIIGESAVDARRKTPEVKYDGLDLAAKDSEGA